MSASQAWHWHEDKWNPCKGEHEAVGTHLKNHSNDNVQNFIYLRVKGQGFHWPEMPEAWLLSTTPVVLLQNPYEQMWQQLLGRRELFKILVVFSSMHDLLSRHGP